METKLHLLTTTAKPYYLLKIQKLQKNAFAAYMKSEGKLGGQNKVPRLANDRKIAQGLNPFVIA